MISHRGGEVTARWRETCLTSLCTPTPNARVWLKTVSCVSTYGTSRPGSPRSLSFGASARLGPNRLIRRPGRDRATSLRAIRRCRTERGTWSSGRAAGCLSADVQAGAEGHPPGSSAPRGTAPGLVGAEDGLEVLVTPGQGARVRRSVCHPFDRMQLSRATSRMYSVSSKVPGAGRRRTGRARPPVWSSPRRPCPPAARAGRATPSGVISITKDRAAGNSGNSLRGGQHLGQPLP